MTENRNRKSHHFWTNRFRY